MSAQRGIATLPLIIGVVAIAAVALFFFSKGTPAPAPTSDKLQAAKEESQAALDYQDVLKLGGTCFTKTFEDEAGDVEGKKDGSSETIKAPDKKEYDIERVVVGKEASNLVVQWDFKGDITADDHHNLRYWIGHDGGNPKGNDKLELAWEAKDNKWTASYTAADGWDSAKSDFREGGHKTFDPMVELSGNSLRYKIPLDLISKDGQVDGLSFAALMIEKLSQTTYSDVIWPAKETARAGHYTSFYCPKS